MNVVDFGFGALEIENKSWLNVGAYVKAAAYTLCNHQQQLTEYECVGHSRLPFLIINVKKKSLRAS